MHQASDISISEGYIQGYIKFFSPAPSLDMTWLSNFLELASWRKQTSSPNLKVSVDSQADEDVLSRFFLPIYTLLLQQRTVYASTFLFLFSTKDKRVTGERKTLYGFLDLSVYPRHVFRGYHRANIEAINRYS